MIGGMLRDRGCVWFAHEYNRRSIAMEWDGMGWLWVLNPFS